MGTVTNDLMADICRNKGSMYIPKRYYDGDEGYDDGYTYDDEDDYKEENLDEVEELIYDDPWDDDLY
jgi:hypothetical protein